jgi:hypothetical protein
MAGIFVTFAGEDRHSALNIIQSLTQAGLTVWHPDFDATSPEGFKTEVRHQFETAECVVILWSTAASKVRVPSALSDSGLGE